MSDEESLPDPEIEVILEGGDEIVEDIENTQEDTAGNANDEAEEANKKPVKPKRIIKNPQPKLNEQTLKGPRGLSVLDGYFERIKFKGPGHEEEDLNVLMKTYEYWCHRLFPKYPFDSCIEKLEKLGAKRTILTQCRRIRMGLDNEEKVLNSDDELGGNQVPTDGFVDADDQFDQLLANQPEPEITDEQLEQMRKNKEKAERLRLERLQKIKEKSSQLLESNQNTQNSSDISGVASVSSRNGDETEEMNFDQILNIINEGNEENLKEIEHGSNATEGSQKTSRKMARVLSDSENEEENVSNWDRSKKINEETEEVDLDHIINETNDKTVNKTSDNTGNIGNQRTKRILSDSEDDEIDSNQGQNADETEQLGFDQILDIINEKGGTLSSHASQTDKKRISRILSDSEDEDNLVIDEDKEPETELSQILDTNKERQRIIQQSDNVNEKAGGSKRTNILSETEEDDL